MIYECSRTLNPGISKLTYFLAVKLIPLFTIELEIELPNEFGINEVYECITNIAGIVGIHR